MSLEGLDGRGGGRVAPELVDQPVPRHHLVFVQEQHRKQGALPWTSDVDLPTAIGDLQWAENPELRGAPLRSSGRLAAQLWRICSRIATAPP
jgi:hypothetical protein